MYKNGLFEACRQGGAARLERLWDGTSHYLSGDDPAKDFARTVVAIERSLGRPVSEAVRRALTEAILNVSHHAYEFLDPSDPFRRLNKRWWQYFIVNDAGLTMLFYDLGMGIARTMEPDLFQNKDTEILVRAMTKGVSRFREGGRGQGSVDIKRPVVNSEFASLFMLTNKARLEFSTAMQVDRTSLIEESVRGTYIEWHHSAPTRI